MACLGRALADCHDVDATVDQLAGVTGETELGTVGRKIFRSPAHYEFAVAHTVLGIA